jgi:hypothetical protein
MGAYFRLIVKANKLIIVHRLVVKAYMKVIIIHRLVIRACMRLIIVKAYIRLIIVTVRLIMEIIIRQRLIIQFANSPLVIRLLAVRRLKKQ